MKLETRLGIEKRIRNKIVDAMIDAGYGVAVYDGESWACKVTTTKKVPKEALGSVDMEHIHAYVKNPDFDPTKERGPENRMWKPFGWVFLVYGNDGYDVVNDYTTNLEDLMKPVNEYADKQERLYG
jgi:hypothetical protein